MFEYPNGVKCVVEVNIDTLSEFTAELYHKVNPEDKSDFVEKKVVSSLTKGKMLLLFTENFVKKFKNEINGICLARSIF